jgi:hypothetical protein
MAWSVEHTDEFAEWRSGLSESQQDDITAVALLLIEEGPELPAPCSSGISGSKHAQMRELRVQGGARSVRVFYAFDARRTAILLIGDNTGDDRLYERMIPIADALYDAAIEEGGVDSMTGHRPFRELIQGLTPERRARVAVKAAALREAMALEEPPDAPSLPQEEMAAAPTLGQPAAAIPEKRADMHVSHLRRYVEALGGTLEITARFPEASVVIANIGEGTPAP